MRGYNCIHESDVDDFTAWSYVSMTQARVIEKEAKIEKMSAFNWAVGNPVGIFLTRN